MTALPLPIAPAPRRASFDGRGLARRLAGLLVIVAVPLAIGELAAIHSVHPITSWLCAYTPQRLLRGEVWTLPLSAAIAARPQAVGPYTVIPAVVLAPYVLGFGVLRPVRAYFIGHVVATLAAAIVIVLGATLGWREGHVLFHTVDTGVSAGAAAAGGGLAVALARTRWRPVALFIVAGLLLIFTRRIMVENPTRVLADGEHLVALATGAFIEWRWSPRCPPST